MLYLLDANVLIDAHRDYYPIERVPEFWDWLLHQCKQGKVKIPVQIFDEVVPLSTSRSDKLIDWMKENRSVLILNEIARRNVVDQVIRLGYTSNPSATDLEKMGQDPCLISYAYRHKSVRTIVTTERSRPSARAGNRKIPDVCERLGLGCMHTYAFIRELDFHTKWNR